MITGKKIKCTAFFLIASRDCVCVCIVLFYTMVLSEAALESLVFEVLKACEAQTAECEGTCGPADLTEG